MKLKLFFYLLLLGTLLFLAACGAAGAAEPAAIDKPMAERDASADCPTATEGTHQLIDEAHGICFLYPDHYDVFAEGNSSYTIYVDSLLNTEAPIAIITLEPADGRVMEDILADYFPDVDLAAVRFQTIGLDGETAYLLDNLPGQDTNRHAITIYNGQVVNIMVARIGEEYGTVGAQAEVLFETITRSFQFIPVDADATLIAGPECPAPESGTNLYTNTTDGFCLLLLDGYAVDDSLVGNVDSQTSIFITEINDSSHARLFINVTPANGRTVQEITDARLAQLQATLPGEEISYSFGHMLDGQMGSEFSQVIGQDLSREMLFVFNERVYTLTFLPDDPEAGPAYEEMEQLYNIVTDSFSFLTGD